MALPANVRVNMPTPFPAVVQGVAPVSIAKANGIWTVGVSFNSLAVQVPTAIQSVTDYLLVHDDVANTFFKMPIVGLPTSARPQRSITSSPVAFFTSDQILTLNLTSPTTITLPGYASRGGLPLTFKDVGRQAAVNNITIAAAGAELIDGNASILLNVNDQAITLVPFNDGVNTGWFQL